MRTLSVTFTYKTPDMEGELEHDTELDGSNDSIDIAQEIADAINEHTADGEGNEFAENPIGPEQIELTNVECDENVDGHDTLEKIFDFAAAYCECDQSAEVVSAALYLSIPGDDIDEAYQGEYKSDEDFAQETAEQLGEIDRDAKWPHNCIDWEFAAKELMYDYCEHNGHYFRNF